MRALINKEIAFTSPLEGEKLLINYYIINIIFSNGIFITTITYSFEKNYQF